MGRKPGKVNIPMILAIILLFLTLLSVHLTSGLYARYVTTTNASDGARVAKFQVSGSVGENVTVDCQNTNNGEFALTVNNASEVSVEYAVDVIFTEAIPTDELKVTVDGATGIWSADRKTVSFVQVGTLDANAGSQNHSLKFTVLDWSYVTYDAVNAVSAQKELDFTVKFTVEQID